MNISEEVEEEIKEEVEEEQIKEEEEIEEEEEGDLSFQYGLPRAVRKAKNVVSRMSLHFFLCRAVTSA